MDSKRKSNLTKRRSLSLRKRTKGGATDDTHAFLSTTQIFNYIQRLQSQDDFEQLSKRLSNSIQPNTRQLNIDKQVRDRVITYMQTTHTESYNLLLNDFENLLSDKLKKWKHEETSSPDLIADVMNVWRTYRDHKVVLAFEKDTKTSFEEVEVIPHMSLYSVYFETYKMTNVPQTEAEVKKLQSPYIENEQKLILFPYMVTSALLSTIANSLQKIPRTAFLSMVHPYLITEMTLNRIDYCDFLWNSSYHAFHILYLLDMYHSFNNFHKTLSTYGYPFSKNMVVEGLSIYASLCMEYLLGKRTIFKDNGEIVYIKMPEVPFSFWYIPNDPKINSLILRSPPKSDSSQTILELLYQHPFTLFYDSKTIYDVKYQITLRGSMISTLLYFYQTHNNTQIDLHNHLYNARHKIVEVLKKESIYKIYFVYDDHIKLIDNLLPERVFTFIGPSNKNIRIPIMLRYVWEETLTTLLNDDKAAGIDYLYIQEQIDKFILAVWFYCKRDTITSLKSISKTKYPLHNLLKDYLSDDIISSEIAKHVFQVDAIIFMHYNLIKAILNNALFVQYEKIFLFRNEFIWVLVHNLAILESYMKQDNPEIVLLDPLILNMVTHSLEQSYLLNNEYTNIFSKISIEEERRENLIDYLFMIQKFRHSINENYIDKSIDPMNLSGSNFIAFFQRNDFVSFFKIFTLLCHSYFPTKEGKHCLFKCTQKNLIESSLLYHILSFALVENTTSRLFAKCGLVFGPPHVIAKDYESFHFNNQVEDLIAKTSLEKNHLEIFNTETTKSKQSNLASNDVSFVHDFTDITGNFEVLNIKHNLSYEDVSPPKRIHNTFNVDSHLDFLTKIHHSYLPTNSVLHFNPATVLLKILLDSNVLQPGDIKIITKILGDINLQLLNKTNLSVYWFYKRLEEWWLVEANESNKSTRKGSMRVKITKHTPFI